MEDVLLLPRFGRRVRGSPGREPRPCCRLDCRRRADAHDVRCPRPHRAREVQEGALSLPLRYFGAEKSLTLRNWHSIIESANELRAVYHQSGRSRSGYSGTGGHAGATGPRPAPRAPHPPQPEERSCPHAASETGAQPGCCFRESEKSTLRIAESHWRHATLPHTGSQENI